MHNLVEVITTIGKKSDNAATESTITTMGDIVKIVVSGFATNDISMKLTPETELDRFLRLNTHARQSKSRGQPSFAVQVLVQERLARIIVECFAGLSSAIVLDGTTCFIPIELFDVVVEQYHIPYGSREAFVIAAIDVMMYLGDKDFVLKGIEGLLDLPPLEFHSLFVPVLAAFEDADTMERWLAAVEKYPIADVSFEELELISLKSQQDESRQSTRITLSQSDISCLSSLSDEFDRCLKMKQIKYHSVYLANRQLLTSLCVGFLTYQTIVTIIVSITANVSARQAITFTLYTITSAGFGSVMIPKSTGFLLFAVMNVYVSISGLSMLIAQCISYFLAHDKRSNHQYSKRMLAKAGMATIDTILNSSNNPNTLKGKMLHELRQCLVVNAIVPEPNPEVIPKSVPSVHRNHVGEGYLLGGTLLILLFVGTFCTMAIEQWSFVYGLYFSTFALLTVGHGDIVPTSSAGEWFVNFLLPFNFIFVMFYFWMIARIYVRFHGANLTRIEKKLRENLRTNDGTTSSKPSEAKTSNDQLVGSSVHSSESKKPRNRTKQRSNLSKVSDFDKSAGSQKNSGSDIVDSSAPSNLLKQLSDFSKLSECDSSAGPMVNAIRSEMSRRYVRIKQTSDISRMLECDFNDEEYTLATTIAGNKPVLARYLLEQINLAEHSIEGNSAGKVVEESDSVEKNLREAIAGNADNTIVESHGMAISRKVATLIRVARIVIENTRIFKGVIEFDEGYLKLRIGSLNECLDLWKIPQQGRSVFRQVFVDAVLYVGEKQIFEKGIAAFFDLTIVEFVELFSPFVFALGDDDAINHWLVDTEDLSQEIFSTTMERPGDLRNTKLSERRFLDNSLEKFFPVNASNSVLVELNRTLRTRSGMRS